MQTLPLIHFFKNCYSWFYHKISWSVCSPIRWSEIDPALLWKPPNSLSFEITFKDSRVFYRNFRSSVAQLSTANLLAGNNARPTCLTLQGLSPGQARICELFRDHMPAVGAGAKAAIAVSFCCLNLRNLYTGVYYMVLAAFQYFLRCYPRLLANCKDSLVMVK